jgi:hypothetical protein
MNSSILFWLVACRRHGIQPSDILLKIPLSEMLAFEV